ncbi:MAG: 4-hydroxy-tetrahydrodipicolinate synthase [Ruminococcaceae bacterium]|nr:4-hydroxy-tetrahydrodipicolinate synthase [Oscillospiraceae bacterium]
MSNTIFTGACVALVTPFNDDYSVNYNKLEELIEFQIANGTDAICACGTTGEASTLTLEEHDEVIKRTIEIVNGRVPVVAGTGSNDTAYGIATSQRAQQMGADALLLVTPYYNKTSQSGLVKHYQAMADSMDIPFIVYNVPGRTGMNITPATVKELSKIPNVVAIKEASDNVGQVSQIAATCDIDIYSGCDDLIVPIMSVGGKGVISVLSNVIPKETHEMAAACLSGDFARARELQLGYFDLCKALFADVNPVPVKAALNLMGFNVGPCRAPLYEITPAALETLKAALDAHGLLK